MTVIRYQHVGKIKQPDSIQSPSLRENLYQTPCSDQDSSHTSKSLIPCLPSLLSPLYPQENKIGSFLFVLENSLVTEQGHSQNSDQAIPLLKTTLWILITHRIKSKPLYDPGDTMQIGPISHSFHHVDLLSVPWNAKLIPVTRGSCISCRMNDLCNPLDCSLPGSSATFRRPFRCHSLQVVFSI